MPEAKDRDIAIRHGAMQFVVQNNGTSGYLASIDNVISEAAKVEDYLRNGKTSGETEGNSYSETR